MVNKGQKHMTENHIGEQNMDRVSANRRELLKRAGAGTLAAMLPLPALAQGAPGRIVVIGGGFAGTTCARFLKRLDPRLNVTLVEAGPTFIACPMSNAVIAGLRELKGQEFGYQKLAADQVMVNLAAASGVDTQARVVTLSNGARLSYDRLVLAPGIDIRWDGLPGYNEAAAERMPHAWKAESRRCCSAASSKPWRMAAPS